MRVDELPVYRCPYTGEPLALTLLASVGGEVTAGRLRSPSGREYAIEDGIAHLIDFACESFNAEEQRELDFYQRAAGEYDAIMDWVFRSFYEDEDRVREGMLEPLRLQGGERVLETGCGTCRDSVRIARRLGNQGVLFLQDLSAAMLRLGKRRVEVSRDAGELACQIDFFSGNAMRLPFADGFFDAAFHFGGINVFADQRQALAEMARVVRSGGRVVVGDEGLAPWLRDREYGRILVNSSPLYAHQPPVEALPPAAREAAIHWLLGNAYYLIAFTVGDGEPQLDMDLPIVGSRGGTHRSRYYGVLEGVTPETKRLASEAAARAGMTTHEWLDRAVRERAACEVGRPLAEE
jgi:ubiquinone/menaquinone biosynthesis C-methylase UbiE